MKRSHPCCLSAGSPDCSPTLLNLQMQLGRHHHRNKHDNKSSPCCNDLNDPAFPLIREQCQQLTLASIMCTCPEPIAITVALTIFGAPWWETPATGRATCIRWIGDIHTRTTQEFPRTHNQDCHGLEICHDGRHKHKQCWELIPPHGFTSPVNKLHQVEHDCHHQSNLESMKEIDRPCTCTTIHHRCSDIQQGRNDHWPTSCTNDGRKG